MGMSSSSKARNVSKAARTCNNSPDDPPSSPVMQSPKSKSAAIPVKHSDEPQAHMASSSHESTSTEGAVLSTYIEIVQQLKEIATHLKTKSDETDEAATQSATDLEPAVRGSKLEVKDVREVWDSTAYAYKILDSRITTAVTELDTYAFVIRTRVLKGDAPSVVYVDINLLELREILKVVFKDIMWVSLAGDKPMLEQNLLFHHLPELEAYGTSADATNVHGLSGLKALDLLVRTIKDRLATTSKRLYPLLQEGKITYDLLWTLFKTNSRVITTCPGSGQTRCLQYNMGEEMKTEQGVEYFELQCQYLDFDGKIFGTVIEKLSIERFRGAQAIDTLHVYPIRFHRTADGLTSSLASRGRKFIDLMGTHHRAYDGIAFRHTRNGLIKTSLTSDIIIDVEQFRKAAPNYARIVTKKIEEGFYSDSVVTEQRVMNSDRNSQDLTDDEVMLCPPTVLGMSLGNKFWGEYAVDLIRDITPSSIRFESLSIPAGIKDTLRAVTSGCLRRSKAGGGSDLEVNVPGRGAKLLLYGPPGVGKTLTAKALSEYHQRPLYSMSSGELSSDAAELDVQLSNLSRLASAWNAIVLIDEADVFLQQRAQLTLERNRLVAVFLRSLDCFDGILILTTNLIDQFDSAVLDRMHLKIEYKPLNADARGQIISSTLERICGSDRLAHFDTDHLKRFANVNINGRQIVNIISVAHALALQYQEELSCFHIDQALAGNSLYMRDTADNSLDLYD